MAHTPIFHKRYNKRRTPPGLSPLAILFTLMLAILYTQPSHALSIPTNRHDESALFFPGSGVTVTTPQGGTPVRLAALAPPKGAGVNSSLPAWCVELDNDAPGGGAVVQVSSLKETVNVSGDAGLQLTTAQLATALDAHQLERNSVTLAALAYLVHVNMEQGHEATTLIPWLIKHVKQNRADIDARARELAQEARSSTAHSYETIQPTGNKQYEGTVENIGLKNASGQWIVGRKITAKIEGPAIFLETGTTEWAGVSQPNAVMLHWRATGNGDVKIIQGYEKSAEELLYLVHPDGKIQNTIQYPHQPHSYFTNVESPGWRVQYDFQPSGVSHVQKITETGSFTDSFEAYADPNYGNGIWAKFYGTDTYIPVTYRATAYYVGELPPAKASSVPKEAEVIGTVTHVAHGPGKLSADFTTKKPGFVTVVWSVEKNMLKEGENRDRVAGNWADYFGIPEETTSFKHRADVDSSLSIRETKSGTYLVDDIWIHGLPSDHGKFTGDGRFVADEQHITQSLLFFPEGLSVSEENRAKATVVGSVKVPATNGFHPSIGDSTFIIAYNKDGSPVLGTYVFVTSFKGDDRVEPFESKVTDVKEQYTVKASPPELKTTATNTSTGEKTMLPEPKQSITDRVCDTKKSLKPGKTYTISTQLMLDDGKPLMNNGKPVTVTTQFTPKSADECANIVIPFDATGLENRKIVVFENVADEHGIISFHHDLTDTDQTVSVTPSPTPPPNLVKTGVGISASVIAMFSLIGSGIGMLRLRRQDSA